MEQAGPLPIEAPLAGPGSAGQEARDATRGSAIKLAAESAGRLLTLVTTLVVARRLGVVDFGLFAALSGAAVLVAEAAELGLQPTASRALVAGTLSLRAMLRAKLALSVGVALVALGLLAVWPLLGALVLYFTLAGWSEFLGVALRARGRRVQEAVTILCLRATGLGAAALSLASGGGTLGLAWALAASTAPPIVLGAGLLRGAGPDHGGDPGVLPLLRSSLPLGLNGGLALVSLRLEVLATGALRGAADAGVFASALRVIEPMILVPSSVAGGAMPALTREALRGGGGVRERTSTTTALLAVPAAAGLALVAPGLLPLLFGTDFALAGVPLQVLSLALVPLFMNGVLLHALIAAGKAPWLPRLTALRVVAAAVLALTLIPRFGALGAAVGFLVSEAALLLLSARACAAARFDVPVVRPLALGALASLPMVAAVALVRGGPLASIAVGVLTYAVTVVAAWRFTPRLFQVIKADVRYS